MYKNIAPIFIKAISGIHAGSGSDLGLVDLPIQRERYSGLPKIESSSVKGCIREELRLGVELQQIEGLPNDFITIAFGPEDDGDKHAGSIAFTDARLLLFPVRSAKGVFAYATCPYILKRLAEDFAMAGIPLESFEETDKAQVSSTQLLIPKSSQVVLEEYTFDAKLTDYAEKLANTLVGWLKNKKSDTSEKPEYFLKYIKEKLIILSDDHFRDFAQNNTEIITRTRIDIQKGTVAKGALFTEELLPAETILYSLVMTSKIFIDQKTRESSETVAAAGKEEGKYLLDTIADKLPAYLQIGGDATTGKGLCRVTVGV